MIFRSVRMEAAPSFFAAWPGWLASLMAHLAILTAFFFAGSPPPIDPPEIVWVKLGSVYLPPPAAAPQPPTAQHENMGVSPSPPAVRTTALPAANSPEPPNQPFKRSNRLPFIQPARAKTKLITARKPSPSPPRPAPQPSADRSEVVSVGQSVKSNPIVEKPVSTAEGQTTLTGLDQAKPAEQIAQDYLHLHLEAIRSSIISNLRYPAMARRQGWIGRVHVRFTILPSGRVESLQVRTSSGYPLLDRQALQAVRDSEPFPRPSTVATITLPVAFQLD